MQKNRQRKQEYTISLYWTDSNTWMGLQ